MDLFYPRFYLRFNKLGLTISLNIFFLLLGSYISIQAQSPTITSFSPASVCQGQSVTINGTNFTGATDVKLGTDNAINFSINSPTSITANVSAQAASGTITVTTSDGTATSSTTLTVLPAPRPGLTDESTLDAPFTNCDGNAIYQLTVSNSSVTTGTGNVYQIDWGDNTPPFTQTDWPTNAQTTHTYNAQGYFPIIITITPSNGCTKSVVYQFYNGKNPLASFTTTSSTTGLCVPAPVEFQIGNWFNNSPGTTYVVDFGDGSPNVTLQHPLNPTNTTYLLTHQYATSSCPSADFTATLKATNGCFTTTYTLNQIIIRQKPVADFSTQPSSSCVNAPVCFTNQTVNGYAGNSCNRTSTFIWDFGDNTTSTEKNPPCHTYATAGTYTVKLTASNTACGSDVKIKQIIVGVTSPPPVVAATPAVYCQGQPAVPLTATGTGLLWYTSATGGAGSSTAPTPSTNTPGTITYYVSQTIPNDCESPRVPVTVTVNALPNPPVVTTPVQLCLNQTAAPLTATGTGLLWYTSATGGTGSPTAPTPSTNAIGNTTWYVSQTINGCEGPRAAILVTVSALAEAPVVASPITYCQGQPAVPLTATGTGLLWYTSATGGTGSSTAPTPSTAITGSTIYYVSQVTGCGEGPRASITVTVNPSPSASISYTPAILCNVMNTAATPNPPVPVNQTGASGGSYSISPATGLPIDATTGGINPSGATAGVYTIRYTIPGTGGCADYVTTVTVTVSGSPTATINYTGSPYCGGTTTPQPVLLSGTPGGTFSAGPGLSINATSGEINPALSTPGVYTVTYTIAASPPCPGYVTTANVAIDESPVLTFPIATQSICSGETAVFVPSSTVANTTYAWSVIGPLPANVAGVSSGTSSGSSPISLSFTNTGTIHQSITVQVIPVNPSQSPCSGAPYNLVLVVNPATPAPVTDTANFCMNEPPAALNVDPLPGTTIKWYDENAVLLSAAPVINTAVPTQFLYYVSQTNSYGCESPKSAVLAIVHPTVKIISSSYTNPTTCGIPSGAIILNVLDLNNGAVPNIPVVVHYNKFQTAYTFSGSTDASGKITIPLTAGTYSGIYVATSGGCTSQKIPDVFILKDPTPPAKPVAGYNPPLCAGTPLTLTALSATNTQAGPVNYVWAGPAFGPFADTVSNTVISFPSAAMSDAGTYAVYAIQNNCISLPADFEVVINQSPSKPVIVTRTPLCVGDDLVLQAYSSIPGNAALNYLWKGPGAGFPVNAPNAGINKVKIEDAGIYTVTVSSSEIGCSATSDTLIQIGGYPIVKFAQDTLTLPTGHRLNLAPVITNATDPGILPIQNYTWTPLQDLNCNDAICSSPLATVKNDVCYTVKATNIYGCSGSDDICVKVFCQHSQVFIPNAFAPRGNVPENKKLMVRATGINTIKSFRVFNRWGRVLFERSNFPPNSAEFGWDGRVNGKLADTGVYIYTVDVICENGIPYSFKGNVTLF